MGTSASADLQHLTQLLGRAYQWAMPANPFGAHSSLVPFMRGVPRDKIGEPVDRVFWLGEIVDRIAVEAQVTLKPAELKLFEQERAELRVAFDRATAKGNPTIGEKQPDLFVPEGTAMFVHLDDLSDDELRAMKRRQFTDDEWNQLDEDLADEIFEADADAQARVDEFVAIFVDRYKWTQEATHRDAEEELGYELEEWIRVRAGEHRSEGTRPHSRRRGRRGFPGEVPDRTYERMVSYADRKGLPDDWVDDQIEEFMSDTNNYSYDTDGATTRNETNILESSLRGDIYVERHDWVTEYETCTPDERVRAYEQIKRETDHTVDIKDDDLERRRHEFSVDDIETPFTAYAYINWDHLEQFVNGRVEEHDGEMEDEEVTEGEQDEQDDDDIEREQVRVRAQAAAAERARQRDDGFDNDDGDLTGIPPDQRTIHRWADGFYVLDLVPSELGAEGDAMGMCVGRKTWGYGQAVRDREIKILSLRRPSGKILFTIEAHIEDDKVTIGRFDQVAGKANRFPGYDLGKENSGEPIKQDEVVRILELMRALNVPPWVQSITPVDGFVCPSVTPALRTLARMFVKGDDKWSEALVDRLTEKFLFGPYTAEGARQLPGSFYIDRAARRVHTVVRPDHRDAPDPSGDVDLNHVIDQVRQFAENLPDWNGWTASYQEGVQQVVWTKAHVPLWVGATPVGTYPGPVHVVLAYPNDADGDAATSTREQVPFVGHVQDYMRVVTPHLMRTEGIWQASLEGPTPNPAGMTRRLGPGRYEGTYRGIEFTIAKVKGQPQWKWQIGNSGGHDWRPSKAKAIAAAQEWIVLNGAKPNPARVPCPIHGAQCTGGFCAPFRRRPSRR